MLKDTGTAWILAGQGSLQLYVYIYHFVSSKLIKKWDSRLYFLEPRMKKIEHPRKAMLALVLRQVTLTAYMSSSLQRTSNLIVSKLDENLMQS